MTGLIGALLLFFGYRFMKMREAVLGTIEDSLIWITDAWSDLCPAGYVVSANSRWGYVSGVTIKDAEGIEVYHVGVKIRRSRIVVEVRPDVQYGALYGNTCALGPFLGPFIDRGLKAMGVPEVIALSRAV